MRENELQLFIDELEQGEIIKISTTDIKPTLLFVFGSVGDTVFVYNEYTDRVTDIKKLSQLLKDYDVKVYRLKDKDKLPYALDNYKEIVKEDSFDFGVLYVCQEDEETLFDISIYADDLLERFHDLINDKMDELEISVPYKLNFGLSGGDRIYFELKKQQ